MYPCCSIDQYFIPFYGRVIIHCMGLHFVSPSTHWWTLLFFPIWDMVRSTAINICVYIFIWTPIFNCFVSIPPWRISGSYGNLGFNRLGKPPSCFPLQLRYFIFSQVMHWFPISPHTCQQLLFSFSKNYSHSSGCEVVSHHGLGLHPPP